jgi:hypothetical protein
VDDGNDRERCALRTWRDRRTVKMRTLLRLLGALVVANVMAAAMVWACGPDFAPLPTVTVLEPGDPAAFDRGEIGVVRPRFRRARLAMAYRVFNSQPPLKINDDRGPSPGMAEYAWLSLRDKIFPPDSGDPKPERKRRMIDYVTPLNCLDDAYTTAVRTFADRQSRYGAGSPHLRDWVRAQAAVFANCDEEPLLLPEPAAASADALTKADRAYQTAAAYFYAMHYEEAARRFQAVGDDRSSPWRPYGYYLAARATLRTATMADEASPTRRDALTKAEVELEAVVADPIAAPVHGSARGLLKFVRIRLRPFDRLRELSTRLGSTPGEVPHADLADFSYLLDRQVGDSVDFDYADLVQIERLRGSSDLVDWVLAMQGRGPAARDRNHALHANTVATVAGRCVDARERSTRGGGCLAPRGRRGAVIVAVVRHGRVSTGQAACRARPRGCGPPGAGKPAGCGRPPSVGRDHQPLSRRTVDGSDNARRVSQGRAAQLA